MLAVIALQVHQYNGVTKFPGVQYDMDPLWVPKHVEAGDIQVLGELPAPRWWDAPNRLLGEEANVPTVPRATEPSELSLKIIAGCGYDPGSAAYRFHTAVNECTKHSGAFVRYGDSNPYSSLRQWDGIKDVEMVRALLLDADVVHCHVDYVLPRNAGLCNRPKSSQVLIRHYHGSMPRGRQWPEVHANLDDALGAVLVGARLTLVDTRPGRMYWLPIAIPADRYAAMSEQPKWSKQFRVAHSPTRRDYKGTEEFMRACQTLRKRNVPIEPVLIEGMSHGQALALKATCHATFDSFWLGIQGSGLEAAAMGQPVIAGDPNVQGLYKTHLGACPYVYANTEAELVKALETLWHEKEFRTKASTRLTRYIESYHTYAAVSRMYEDILSEVLGRSVVTTNDRPVWRP